MRAHRDTLETAHLVEGVDNSLSQLQSVPGLPQCVVDSQVL